MERRIRRLPKTDQARQFSIFIVLTLFLTSCAVDNAKSRYILAEKLWADGNYAAAVHEFENVVKKDSQGDLGKQALFRAAMTQSIYLSQYGQAIRKFKDFVELSGKSPESWEAQRQIGEILFEKTQQYELAIQHYRFILKSSPNTPERPLILFRIARSHFFLWQFDEAQEVYKQIAQSFQGSEWAERASYEIGVTLFTRGEQTSQEGQKAKGNYQAAISAFEKFIASYPKSRWLAEAKFGIASCLEEMDQLDQAYQVYESLLSTFPSPNVIKIKLARIHERRIQRGR